MTDAKPLALCITGPTATGKTDAAVAVCRALDGEVLSMDSMQIYQGFDIGTAKATPEEMRGIPHHLLSFVPPQAAYTVAEYQRDAKSAMREVLSHGRLPVFAGGTGLYLQAISHPLRFTEAGGAGDIRRALEAEGAQPGGAQALYERLFRLDPVTAVRLHPNNTRRVIRALEVYEATGRPMSEQSSEWEETPEEDWLIFALTWPRDVLYERINRRVGLMVENGLIDEVRGLLQSGVPENAQSMQAIGYKEIIRHLHGECTLAEALEIIRMNTRRYAKRQLTWLRRDARVRWLDLSAFENAQAELIHQIKNHQEARDARH